MKRASILSLSAALLIGLACNQATASSSSNQRIDTAEDLGDITGGRNLNKAGIQLIEEGEFHASVDAFARALEKPNAGFADQSNYAQALNSAGNEEESFEYYRTFLPIHENLITELRASKPKANTPEGDVIRPDDIIRSTYFEAGMNAFSLRNFEMALNYLLTAEIIGADLSTPISELSLVIASSFRLLGFNRKDVRLKKKATDYFKKFFEDSPETVSLNFYVQAARVAIDAGKDDENYEKISIKWFNDIVNSIDTEGNPELITDKSGFKHIALTLAEKNAEEGNYDLAFHFFSSFAKYEYFEPSSMHLFNTGVMAHVLGDYENAITYLKMAQKHENYEDFTKLHGENMIQNHIARSENELDSGNNRTLQIIAALHEEVFSHHDALMSTRKKSTIDEDVLDKWIALKGQEIEGTPYLYGVNYSGAIGLMDPRRGIVYPVFAEDRGSTDCFLPAGYAYPREDIELGEWLFDNYTRYKLTFNYAIIGGAGGENKGPFHRVLSESVHRTTRHMLATFGLALKTLGQDGLLELSQKFARTNPNASKAMADVYNHL